MAKQVLLIDDDEIFNFITREIILEVYPDAEITSFLSSEEGLEYICSAVSSGRRLPDFLFLDIRMPEMNGFELLEKLESRYSKADLKPMKIYVLSSTLDASDHERANASTLVNGFLIKPLEKVKIKALMHEL